MSDPNLPAGLMYTLSAPMGDLIAAVGLGVAQAQRQMDAATLETLREIATSGHEMITLMRAIGYRPTWYQIPEAEAEIAIALSVSGSEETSGRPTIYAAPVDATYANKFNWSVEASSKLRFRVVPVPPPLQAENLVVVPDLVGRTVADARAVAAAAGASLEISAGAGDDDIVSAQAPSANNFSINGSILIISEARPVEAPPQVTIRAVRRPPQAEMRVPPQPTLSFTSLKANTSQIDDPEE